MTETSLGKPNATAVAFFFVFIVATLAITGWAARRTKTTSEFFAAGSKVTGFQNGLALAGDCLSSNAEAHSLTIGKTTAANWNRHWSISGIWSLGALLCWYACTVSRELSV